MRAFIVVILLVSLPAAADRDETIRLRGWTADGATVYYEPLAEDAGVPTDIAGPSASVSFGIAADGRSGVGKKFFLSSTGDPTAKEKKAWKAMPQKVDWAIALANNKPSCAATGQAGLDGVTLDVAIAGKGVKGRWRSGGEFAFFYDGDDFVEKRATLTIRATREGRSATLATWPVDSPGASQGGGLSGDVRACWAPGGLRVALVLHRRSGMMRAPGDTRLVVAATRGPRVQLVADAAILGDAIARVAAKLEAAGFVATGTKASNEAKPRASTVIYAAAGFEADAAQASQAVPGGATVEKLDWKAPYDLVVGIGATAMK
jgi:hypothetical protein